MLNMSKHKEKREELLQHREIEHNVRHSLWYVHARESTQTEFSMHRIDEFSAAIIKVTW